MKKTILAITVAFAGASAQAATLNCSKQNRVESIQMQAELLENDAVLVNLNDNGSPSTMTGHFKAEDSLPNLSIYELSGDSISEGTLEIKKTVSSFPGDNDDCLRCFVAPTFTYKAILTVDGKTYDFSKGFFSQCHMSHN